MAGIALLVLMTFLIYRPALHGELLWDDTSYIEGVEGLQDVGGLRTMWLDTSALDQYYPLTFSVLWLEYRLWEKDTLGYHLVNVALHVLNAVLLWCVLRYMGLRGAFLAAALFAFHPVNVASVAWIAELKNVLSGMFYLLCLLSWLRFAKTSNWAAYAVAVVLFVPAMLSKTAVLTLPMALIIWVWWRRAPHPARLLLSVGPFFLIGLAFAWITVRAEGNVLIGEGFGRQMTLVQSILIAGRALCFYVGKLLLPVNLMNIYPKWDVDPAVIWQFAFPAGVAILLVLLWAARRRMGRGPLAVALYFTCTLGPILGFKDFGYFGYSYVADHFLYLAAPGAFVGFAWIVTRANKSLDKNARWLGPVLACALLGVLGAASWNQSRHYRTRERFWLYNVERNPTYTANSALGEIYLRQGNADKAEQYQLASLAIKDNARARFRLGEAYEERDEFDKALEQYQLGLEINRRKDRIRVMVPRLHGKIASVYWQRQEWAKSAEHFRLALEADPEWELAREWLAKAEQRKQLQQEAAKSRQQVE